MFRCTNPSHHHLVWPIHYMLYNNDIDKKHKNTNKSVSIPISVRACRSVWGGVGWSAFVWRLSCSCCSLGWSRRDARSSPTPGRGSPRLSPGWTLPQQLCGENYINICFVINNSTNIWHSLFSFTPPYKDKTCLTNLFKWLLLGYDMSAFVVSVTKMARKGLICSASTTCWIALNMKLWPKES